MNSVEGPFEYISKPVAGDVKGLLTYTENAGGKVGELLDGAGDALGAALSPLLTTPEGQYK